MNTIINKDCIEGIKDVPDNCVDIIIADPPYNIGKNFGNNTSKMSIQDYLDWCDKWIVECLPPCFRIKLATSGFALPQTTARSSGVCPFLNPDLIGRLTSTPLTNSD